MDQQDFTNKYADLVEIYLNSSVFIERKYLMNKFQNNLFDKRRLHAINQYRVRKKLPPYYLEVVNGQAVVSIHVDGVNKKIEILQNFPPLPTVYTTLAEIHNVKHCSTNDMMKEVEEKIANKEISDHMAGLPVICYDLIHFLCKTCHYSPRKAQASRIGSVCFMYQMNLVKSSPFSCIMAYIDENTEFVFLRPIEKNAFDVVTELFKLFMQIGVPDEITIKNSDDKMCDDIERHMLELHPSLTIKLQKIMNTDCALVKYFVAAMGAWLKDAELKLFQLGCSVVQHKVNNCFRTTEATVTPHELFYRSNAIFNLDSLFNP